MYAGLFMLIFALCVFLFGLYIYTGHDVSKLFWRASLRNLKKCEWINIGKWVMISSSFIGIIGILLMILQLD